MKYRFKLPHLGITESALNALPFGRQIEYLQRIRQWQATATIAYVSQKRTTSRKALADFIALCNVKEYFFADMTSSTYRDDSFAIAYK